MPHKGFADPVTYDEPGFHLNYNTPAVIHPFMSLCCRKHVFETLQRIVIFHVCCLYEMNSVQHPSATCASHFSETWLVSTMQQDHETCET